VTAFDLDVIVTRGDMVESRHQVHAAVCDAHGHLVGFAGQPDLVTHWRSCAKPFQVHRFVADGHLANRGWGTEALALACASHGGEPEHVMLAQQMLTSLGLDESALACGPHEPLAARGASLLRERGDAPTRLHNNCSGKHSAMMAHAIARGWSPAGYHEPTHPVQRLIVEDIAQWTGQAPSAVRAAVDGCGVPVFILSLRQMASAYGRFAGDATREQGAPRAIFDAMAHHSFLVGGTDRFDTLIMDATQGNVVCKIGAEGVHSLAIRDRALGLAVKAADGAPRAQYPAVLRLLQRLHALPDPLEGPLARWLVKPVKNTRGEVVGEVRPNA
jgi:L-asparaginase II